MAALVLVGEYSAWRTDCERAPNMVEAYACDLRAFCPPPVRHQRKPSTPSAGRSPTAVSPEYRVLTKAGRAVPGAAD
jgi:hypothetical protein